MIEERFVSLDGLKKLQRLPDFAIADDFFRTKLKCCYCGEVTTLEPYGKTLFICSACNASLNEGYRFVGLYDGSAFFLENGTLKHSLFDKVFVSVDEIETYSPKPRKLSEMPKLSMRMTKGEWVEFLKYLGVTFIILLILGKIIQELIKAGLFP